MQKNHAFFILCTALSLGFPVSKAVAEDLIKSSGELSVYQVPRNAVDTVKSWFGRNEDQHMYQTKEGLFLSDYEQTKKSDGSVDIKLNIYNRFVMDGFVEVYNKDGTIADIKVIEGNSASENLVESGSKLVTEVPTNSLKYNYLIDPRRLAKETSISLKLNAGQRADFSTSSPRVFVHNLILAGLGLGGFASSLSNAEVTGLVADFLKELSSDGKLIYFASALTQNQSSDKMLKDQVFVDLMKEFKQYLEERVGTATSSIAQSILKDKLSDVIDEVVGKLGPLGAATAGASKVVFGVSKVSNFSLRFDQSLKQFLSKQVPFSLGLDAQNAGGEKSQPVANTISSSSASNKLNQAMQDYSSCITQYSASRIGSASCFIARSPAQASIYEQQWNTNNIRTASLQERSQYTNGQIVRAPLDIGLTWNQNTLLDLDSHLVTPGKDHIYFSQRGSLDQSPNAFLYRDSIPDGGRRGAEQTRITQFQNGEYRFYVYNYSDYAGSNAARAAGANGLSNSGASVQLYEGGAPLTNIPNDSNTFDLNNPNVQRVGNPYPGESKFGVPTNQPGNTWYVFKLDTRTGILYKVNRLGNAPDSQSVPNIR